MEDWIDIKDDDGGRVKEKKKIGIGERGREGRRRRGTSIIANLELNRGKLL